MLGITRPLPKDLTFLLSLSPGKHRIHFPKCDIMFFKGKKIPITNCSRKRSSRQSSTNTESIPFSHFPMTVFSILENLRKSLQTLCSQESWDYGFNFKKSKSIINVEAPAEIYGEAWIVCVSIQPLGEQLRLGKITFPRQNILLGEVHHFCTET